ncbi:neutral zinc metallopeptidase [Jannaschia sp. Os4]|uniref:KPN_02809 family neutral zinc metallopeptidase n=1 Tax=Jannaschia sp. Os4 TaxID=2807617 RepID=UPI00193A5FEA|nr:neutral zinc metallopeptidase [Jannaschia sp. Os4]MBM2577035.1 neutral zinc metallopeptidase [Jannaschia sp. Os4]
MRWRGRRGSRNIEDRRGRGGFGGRTVRIGGGRAGGTAKLGGFGLIIVLALGWFLGIDVTPLLSGGGQVVSGVPTQTRPISEAEQQEAQFVSVVLADTEEVWADLFQRQVGRAYDPATLVLYSGVTQSPCGGASGATGPFYCPADGKIYLDTEFFTTMERQLGARGDFAAAYVVAHEVAHHVQQELGFLGEANAIRRRVSEGESNAISVRIELQADCYSGIWARAAQQRFGTLEPGDVDEAVNAARRIGDDHLAERAGRVPMPHTFTHGTSEQRSRWFTTGWETGDMAACDTFGTDRL